MTNGFLNSPQAGSIARILAGVGVTYAATQGWIPSGDHPELVAVGTAVILSGWGWASNTITGLVSKLAAAKGTSVTSNGTSIRLHDPKLQTAAENAATNVKGE